MKKVIQSRKIQKKESWKLIQLKNLLRERLMRAQDAEDILSISDLRSCGMEEEIVDVDAICKVQSSNANNLADALLQSQSVDARKDVNAKNH